MIRITQSLSLLFTIFFLSTFIHLGTLLNSQKNDTFGGLTNDDDDDNDENYFQIISDTGTCSRISFLDYVQIFSNFRWADIENIRPTFGPQEPPGFYDDVANRSPRDWKQPPYDDYDNEDDVEGDDSTPLNVTGGDKNENEPKKTTTEHHYQHRNRHQLEADLKRMLARESHQQPITPATPKPQNVSASTTTATEPPQQQDADPPLPSFNEWTKQKLEEQQQQQQQQSDALHHQKNGAGGGGPTNTVGGGVGGGVGNGGAPASGAGVVSTPGSPSTVANGGEGSGHHQIPVVPEHHHPHPHQEHARNYASKECGAKVLLANPQAQHASAVLNEKEPDEYMLNPCIVEQKFFVLELCETIQISRLDLANFELFSSSPKDFRVFVSERYPSSEWTFLGAWTAEDQRKIQHFSIEQRLYAKYVKVELQSHYGSEHFCPLSLIRVLGVSVVEEYEAGAAQEHRQQLQFGAGGGEGSAIGGGGGGQQQQVVEMMAEKTAEEPFFDSSDPTINEDLPPLPPPSPSDSPSSVIPEQQQQNTRPHELLHTAKDVVMNLAKGVIDKAQAVFSGSKSAGNTSTMTAITNLTSSSPSTDILPPPSTVISEHWRRCLTCDVSTNGSRRLCGYVRAFMVKRRPRPMVSTAPSATTTTTTSTSAPSDAAAAAAAASISNLSSLDEESVRIIDEIVLEDNQQSQQQQPKATVVPIIPPSPTSPPTPGPPSTYANNIPPQDASSLPGVASSGKESVFARLNNRIRTLETNLSLSGEYLSQLSLRYRKQMDDVQKAVNRSNSVIADHKTSTDEQLSRYRAEIESIKEELEKVKSILEIRGGGVGERRDEENTVDNVQQELPSPSSYPPEIPTWIPIVIGVQVLFSFVLIISFFCNNSRTRRGTIDERALEEAVDRRVRLAVAEFQQLKKQNGITLDLFAVNSEQSESNSNLPGNFGGNKMLSSKQQRKARKRQQQQQQQQQQEKASRKSSDGGIAETPSSRRNQSLSRSPAGILFSSNSKNNNPNPNTNSPPGGSGGGAPWRQVPLKSTATTTHRRDQQRRQNSWDPSTSSSKILFTNTGSGNSSSHQQSSKAKLYSHHNAFEVLAHHSSSAAFGRSSSAASIAAKCRPKSPEKRPAVGRGPS